MDFKSYDIIIFKSDTLNSDTIHYFCSSDGCNTVYTIIHIQIDKGLSTHA